MNNHGLTAVVFFMANKPRTFGGQLSSGFGAKRSPSKVRGKKRGAGKILVIARGPIKLKPTQAHKNKRAYSRKKEKERLKSLIKTS